jgi:hypothetical protein
MPVGIQGPAAVASEERRCCQMRLVDRAPHSGNWIIMVVASTFDINDLHVAGRYSEHLTGSRRAVSATCGRVRRRVFWDVETASMVARE